MRGARISSDRSAWLALTACLGLVVFSQPALADDPAGSAKTAQGDGPVSADDVDPPEQGELPPSIEVRIVGEKADAIQKIPGSFTTIDNKELSRARPIDAAEMLRRVPGLLVRQDTSGGSRVDIGIRGLDPGRSRRLLVLEDGMPLAINPYAEPDLYFSPQIERYEKIEVLKGSGSILYGPQTLGGVVNFSTAVPRERIHVRVSMDAGEYGYSRLIGRVSDGISLGADSDPVRVLGQLVIKRGDGPRNQPFKDYDGLLKIALPTGPRGELTLKVAGHHALAVSEDVGLTRGMFEADPRREVLSPDSRMELSRFDFSATHDAELADGVSLKTLGYLSLTERVWTRQRFDRLPQAGRRYDRIVGDVGLPLGALYFYDESRVLDRSYFVLGLEPRLTAKFTTGGVAHTLETGLRILGEGASAEELSGGPAGSFDGQLIADESHETTAFAGYVQDRVAFLDELVITPGLRLEHATYLRDVGLAPGVADAGQGRFSDTTLIPGLGATVGVPEVHAFAGIHVGYAPPRATTAITDQGQSEVLDAERSTNYEVGLRANPARWQKNEISGYLNRFTNQIVPQTVPGGVTELVNGGATQALGADFSTKVEIGRAFDLEQSIDVAVRGGLMHASFEGSQRDGKVLPYAPAYTFGGQADVDLSFGLGFGAQVTHVGEHYADELDTVLPDASGRVGRIDAYTLVDASIRYRERTTGIGSALSVKNLLDSPFVIARRPEGIHTAGTRQIVATLDWHYDR